MSRLGEQLRRLRRRAGLTQADLAALAGLSGNSLISRIETGETAPSSALLGRLARAVGVDRDALALLSDEPSEAAHTERELVALQAAAETARQRLEAVVDALVGEVEAHHESLATFVGASRMGLVWTLDRKLRRERRAREVWVMTPDLGVDLTVPQVLPLVRANLEGGARYRYLLPDAPRIRRRAAKLLAALDVEGGHVEDGHVEVRFAEPAAFDFALETVLYDPRDQTRRLGLLVAPTRRPEIDAVLGSEAARRFQRAFSRRWRSAARAGDSR